MTGAPHSPDDRGAHDRDFAAARRAPFHRDRAAVVATDICQIASQTRDPTELRIEPYLRDEFADLERQIAADRSNGGA